MPVGGCQCLMPFVSRIIRKYPNRRLYDPTLSAYVTLGDLRKLILSGETFSVVDARTDSDLTHGVLLQLLFEGETGGKGVLNQETLLRLIRIQIQGGSLGVLPDASGTYPPPLLHAGQEAPSAVPDAAGDGKHSVSDVTPVSVAGV